MNLDETTLNVDIILKKKLFKKETELLHKESGGLWRNILKVVLFSAEMRTVMLFLFTMLTVNTIIDAVKFGFVKAKMSYWNHWVQRKHKSFWCFLTPVGGANAAFCGLKRWKQRLDASRSFRGLTWRRGRLVSCIDWTDFFFIHER